MMEPVGMNKPRRPRRVFTPVFKAEIVELCQRGDRSLEGRVGRDGFQHSPGRSLGLLPVGVPESPARMSVLRCTAGVPAESRSRLDWSLAHAGHVSKTVDPTEDRFERYLQGCGYTFEYEPALGNGKRPDRG
jgi:hypothetical protein